MKKITIDKIISIIVFGVLYYIYMNSVRKVMIPLDNIVIPSILALLVVISFIYSKGKITVRGRIDKMLCLAWITILIYISINNTSFFYNLIYRGMIQLFSMIVFMCLSAKSNNWMKTWIKASEIFVIIHAVATILFYFNGNLYSKFANIMFSGKTLTSAIKYYNKGYMSGLSSHFSTNGMILGIGTLLFFGEIYNSIRNKKEKNDKIKYIIMFFITLYALILSSKRSPLIASFISIAATYIISNGKNVIRNIIVLLTVCIIGWGGYKVLLPNIPGLSTIADKFEKTEESDAGVLNGRSGLWKLAVDMFKENPILGMGYGSYSERAKGEDAITTSAHNYYLQVLSELGIIGLILYIIAMGTGILLGIKTLNYTSKNDEKMLIYACISLAIQFFVLIYSITATALMYYDILVPYFLSLTSIRCIYLKSKNTNIEQEDYKKG